MPIDSILYDTVRDDIDQFNKNRRRRKELAPVFVGQLEAGIKYRKFGMNIELGDSEDAFEAVRRVAHKVVPTLLRRKPRPQQIRLDIAETAREPVRLLVRLAISKDRTVRLD